MNARMNLRCRKFVVFTHLLLILTEKSAEGGPEEMIEDIEVHTSCGCSLC